MGACLSLPAPAFARLYRCVGFRAHHGNIADVGSSVPDKPSNALAKSMILRQNVHIMLKILRFIGKLCLFLGFLWLIMTLAGVIVGIFATIVQTRPCCLLAVLITAFLL